MNPAQAGEGRAEDGKAGLQSATVRCLAASITARTTSASRTLSKEVLSTVPKDPQVSRNFITFLDSSFLDATPKGGAHMLCPAVL